MRLFGTNVGIVYITTIILLITITVLSSYLLKIVPYSLFATILVSIITEYLIVKLYLKKQIKLPFSAIITGFIIGSIAPLNTAIFAAVLASIIAILSKFLIKLKGRNVFNPAAFGLIVGLGIFGIGDEWWAASNINIYAFAVPIAFIFIITAYQAKRILPAITFVLSITIISILINFQSISSVLTMLLSINYLFAFLMVVDPKTSPYKKSGQIVYGIMVAIIYTILSIVLPFYSYLIALLLSNALYAIYRKYNHHVRFIKNKHAAIVHHV